MPMLPVLRRWGCRDRASARSKPPVLANTIDRLLGARLGQPDADPNLLQQMQQGMKQLAERDADQQLASLLQQLGTEPA